MMYEWHKKEAPLLGLQGSGGGLGFLAGRGGIGQEFVLVWTMDASGDARSPNFKNFGTVTETDTSVTCTQYSAIPSDWTRMWCTSRDRGHVWIFENTSNTRDVLASLCNNYADWTIANNDPSGRSVNVSWGSSRYGIRTITGSEQGLLFQHNNSGTETHDIPTLGTSSYVWGNSMFWGNIDAVSNYGGIMNLWNPHSGSGGGSTGDKLFVYLEYSSAGDHTNYTNYLTPTGPLGDATQFTWTHSGGSGVSGDPAYLADAVSRNTSDDWTSYGFQHADPNAWIQVDLGAGNETAFDFTFAIGYPSGSHYSNHNFIQASNDNSSWDRVAEWSDHNNDNTNDYTHGYLYYGAGSHMYSNTIDNVGKWIAIKNRTAYRYWRIAGDNFNHTNGYQLLINWALLKKNT